MAEVVLIASNKMDAGVLDIARENHITTFILNKENFRESDVFIRKLKELKIDFLILAGFLWKVPSGLVSAFENRIVNIHPALLPKYGGRGMYGHFVHDAVHAAKESESGITVHLVNEHYDEGNIIFQSRVSIDENDTPQSIEKKVRALEMEHFPQVIERFLSSI